MRRYRRFFFVFCSLSLFSVAAATKELSMPQHVIEDWSNRHVVFTGLTLENIRKTARPDPRVWNTWLKHRLRTLEVDSQTSTLHHRRFKVKDKRQIDWSMPLGSIYGELASPAKFGFNVDAVPDCAQDYVVFPTANSSHIGVAGDNASLIAFNNLYTGPGPTGICPTPTSPATQPSVLFAYNTATAPGVGVFGFAELSPVLSLDGKKIAFVETTTGNSNSYTAFHVLTWKAGEGTAWNSAAVPGDCSVGHSCMTTVILSTTHSDSQSNPFVDYANDVAYVGDDGGVVHKITPVFNGTPAEVMGNGWPVQLALARGVQSPVFDSVSGLLFVTQLNSGTLHWIDTVTGAIQTSTALNASNLSDPIVDSTDQTVFVSCVDASLNLCVGQFSTSGILLRKISTGFLPSGFLLTGAFDHNYYTSPSLGLLYFAGSVNSTATLYGVGFTGSTMNSTFAGPLALTTGTGPSVPTRLTELYNPSFSNAQDRLFVGVEENCALGSNAGCMENLDITNGFPQGIFDFRGNLTIGAQGGLSGIIVDNVSVSPQASSIYFGADDGAAGTTASAVKLTQSGLQ